MTHWFGYFKKQNKIAFTSIDFNLVAPFLRGRDFCVEELSTVKNDKEVTLLRPNEEPIWVSTNQ